MAKIKLSPLVNKIQGSTGPLLFSSSRGVATVRTKKIPTNPNTAQQQAARAAFRDLVSIYNQFNAIEKNLWIAYGASRSLSGVNAFISLSLAGELSGGVWSPSPPGSLTPLTVVGDVNGNCPGTAMMNYSPSSVPSGFVIVIYHRVGNQGDPTPPVMTRGGASGPRSSPFTVSLPGCAAGDNWVYSYIVKGDLLEWSLGFGAPVVF